MLIKLNNDKKMKEVDIEQYPSPKFESFIFDDSQDSC